MVIDSAFSCQGVWRNWIRNETRGQLSCFRTDVFVCLCALFCSVLSHSSSPARCVVRFTIFVIKAIFDNDLTMSVRFHFYEMITTVKGLRLCHYHSESHFICIDSKVAPNNALETGQFATYSSFEAIICKSKSFKLLDNSCKCTRQRFWVSWLNLFQLSLYLTRTISEYLPQNATSWPKEVQRPTP